MWDLPMLEALNRKTGTEPGIATAARALLDALEEARRTGNQVHFCRGVMFLENERDKEAMRKLLEFLCNHNSHFDTDHTVQKEDTR